MNSLTVRIDITCIVHVSACRNQNKRNEIESKCKELKTRFFFKLLNQTKLFFECVFFAPALAPLFSQRENCLLGKEDSNFKHKHKFKFAGCQL